MEEQKIQRGRPKKENAEKIVTLNLRISETDRDKLRDITNQQGNISDTDTIRRWIRQNWKAKK